LAQITDAERKLRVRKLLADLNSIPPEKHEVVRVPGVDREPMLCQAITISADELLFNHRSHRVRSQLEDDAAWSSHANNPHSEEAQAIIARLIKEDRTEERFTALKESLERDGQEHPGLITHDGLLVNGNTRAVAIREFPPGKRQIRVAVLPETVTPEQINIIELRLQMQEDFKGDYSLTNELLFIEDLSRMGFEPKDIAREMRVYPGDPKKGALEIQTRLRILDVLRVMRKIPAEPLPLRYFDNKLALEQMRDVVRNYDSSMKTDPREAQRYLDTILLSVAAGVSSVHQLRRVDSEFVSEYVVSRLEEDEDVGTFAGHLLNGNGQTRDAIPPAGVKALLGNGTVTAEPTNVRNLINIVTQPKKDVELTVENKRVTLDKADIKRAVEVAFTVGIRDKKNDQSAENKLDAPADNIKKASNDLAKALEALRVVIDDDEFDKSRRNKVGHAFKQLRKKYRDAETTLVKAGILEK